MHGLEAESTEYSSFVVAAIYAALGDAERAFDLLERSYRDKERWITTIKIHPWLDPLRDDPRLDDIVRRMNFPES